MVARGISITARDFDPHHAFLGVFVDTAQSFQGRKLSAPGPQMKETTDLLTTTQYSYYYLSLYSTNLNLSEPCGTNTLTMVSVEIYTDIFFSHVLFAHNGGFLVLFLKFSFQRILFSEVDLQRTRNENSPVGSNFLKNCKILLNVPVLYFIDCGRLCHVGIKLACHLLKLSKLF